MKNQKKGKASPKTETLVNFILDKSGSMESVKSATISGFNEYIQSLKKDGNKYSFSLTLFDTMVESPYINEDIKDVKNLDNETYKPDGGTALYDAVCTTIRKVNEKKGQKVINIIMTDGEENSSKEYTQDEMKSLIKEREAKGNWTFVYLGANQDSYAAAQKFGFSKMNVSNYQNNNKGVAMAMNVLAGNTSMYASSSELNTRAFFSAKDQTKLGDEDPVKAHFRSLGNKSWEKRRKDILEN